MPKLPLKTQKEPIPADLAEEFQVDLDRASPGFGPVRYADPRSAVIVAENGTGGVTVRQAHPGETVAPAVLCGPPPSEAPTEAPKLRRRASKAPTEAPAPAREVEYGSNGLTYKATGEPVSTGNDLDAQLSQELFHPDPRVLESLTPAAREEVETALAKRDVTVAKATARAQEREADEESQVRYAVESSAAQRALELGGKPAPSDTSDTSAPSDPPAPSEPAPAPPKERRPRRWKRGDSTPEPAPAIVQAINDRPWGDWPEPNCVEADLSEFRVWPDPLGEKLLLGNRSRQILAPVTPQALQELGVRCSFAPEFVQNKLSAETAARVINERIADTRSMPMVAVIEDGLWTNLVPAWREILPSSRIAEVVYSTLREYYEVEIEQARHENGHLSLRLLTPVDRPISPKVGDVLRMGVDVRSSYGGSSHVSLYAKRLICLNGMTADRKVFRWKRKDTASIGSQIEWLRESTVAACSAYESLVDRAQEMAGTTFEGDPQQALRVRARSMGYPERNLPALYAAFEAEEGHSEWDLLNAFTRVATHAGLRDTLARGIMASCGGWAGSFSMVTARLPRPIAVYVGATIEE